MTNVIALPTPSQVNLVFTGIPIPPSLNNAYPSLKSGLRVKSKELNQWEKNFYVWSLTRIPQIRLAKHVMATLASQAVLSVNCVYYFKRQRILSLSGKPKRLDLDNRIKILLDGLTTLLGVDDCRIWTLNFAKRLESQGYESCSVGIEVSDKLAENSS